MQPDPDGCWCHHSDYLQLRAELDAARAENARLRKLFDDAGQGEYNVLALVEYYQRLAIASESCPGCTSPKVVAACERCGHRWEAE